MQSELLSGDRQGDRCVEAWEGAADGGVVLIGQAASGLDALFLAPSVDLLRGRWWGSVQSSPFFVCGVSLDASSRSHVESRVAQNC